MSDLQRRPGSSLSRQKRERRAFQLVLVGGGASVVAIITVILAIAGVMGWGVPLIAVVVALVAGFLFRRTIGT